MRNETIGQGNATKTHEKALTSPTLSHSCALSGEASQGITLSAAPSKYALGYYLLQN